MFTVIIAEKDGPQRRLEFDKGELTIGRVQGNDVILPKSNVSKRHARLVVKDSKFIVVDLKSTNGTYINGKKITSPQVIRPSDKLYVGDFVIQIGVPDEEVLIRADSAPNADDDWREPHQSAPSPVQPVQASKQPAPAMPASGYAGAVATLESPSLPIGPPGSGMERSETPVPQNRGGSVPAPPSPHSAGYYDDNYPQAPQAGASGDLGGQGALHADDGMGYEEPVEQGWQEQQEEQDEPVAIPASHQGDGGYDWNPQLAAVLRDVHAEVLKRFPSSETEGLCWDAYRERTEATVFEVVDALAASGAIGTGINHEVLIKAALAEALGYGSLEGLIENPTVTRIEVNGSDLMLVDQGMGLERIAGGFSDDSVLLGIITRLVGEAGVVLDETNPVVDVRRADGVRVCAIIPPVAVHGPVFIMTRPGGVPSLAEMVKSDVLPAKLLNILNSYVQDCRNILVAGPQGPARRIMLNTLAGFIPKEERIVTVERKVHLQLPQPNVLALEEPSNPVRENVPKITQQSLVSTALAIESDRVVIDDLGAGGAHVLLHAMAGGVEGVIASVPGYYPADALAGLEVFMRVANSSLSEQAAKELIFRAIHVVLVCGTFAGKHKVTHVVEVTGIDQGDIQFNEVYGLDAEATGDLG